MSPRLILHFCLLYSFGALRIQCWTLNGHAGIIPHHSSHCVLGVRCSEHFASRHCCFYRRSCAASLTAHTFSCCTMCAAKAPCLDSAAAVLGVKVWSLYLNVNRVNKWHLYHIARTMWRNLHIEINQCQSLHIWVKFGKRERLRCSARLLPADRDLNICNAACKTDMSNLRRHLVFDIWQGRALLPYPYFDSCLIFTEE